MQKKATKPSAKTAKKKKPLVKKQDQKFSLKRLIMGEEKPDLTELEAGSTTVLDILSPTTIDTKSRDYIVVDGIFHACLYVAGYGYSTTVGSCWLAPLVEAGEGVNLSFIFKRQSKEKILSKIAQTQNGGAVCYNCYKICPTGQLVALVYILLNFQTGLCNTGSVCERQIVPGFQGSATDHFDLTFPLSMLFQGFFCIIHFSYTPSRIIFQ